MEKNEKRMLDFAINNLIDLMDDIDLALKIGPVYQSLIRLQQKAEEKEMFKEGKLIQITCPYCLRIIKL
jgi:hypothetical protein